VTMNDVEERWPMRHRTNGEVNLAQRGYHIVAFDRHSLRSLPFKRGQYWQFLGETAVKRPSQIFPLPLYIRVPGEGPAHPPQWCDISDFNYTLKNST
jgi:hypothetical protein